MSNVIDMQEWKHKKQEDAIKKIFGQEFWDILQMDMASTPTVTYTFEDDTGELFTVQLSNDQEE